MGNLRQKYTDEEWEQLTSKSKITNNMAKQAIKKGLS